ncbi:hypothetical protein [Methylorubrum sp. POS3]|uniref:hypothetical protein n=1 Tax=Methylorubrum sp. POS3 TaxID=2998492 RepID=UPI003728CB19
MSKAPRKTLGDTMENVLAGFGGPDPEPAEQDAPASAPMPERTSPMPDGRSLRATGRTHQFSTRIKLETHDKMKWLALHERITLGELLERMTDLYEQQRIQK